MLCEKALQRAHRKMEVMEGYEIELKRQLAAALADRYEAYAKIHDLEGQTSMLRMGALDSENWARKYAMEANELRKERDEARAREERLQQAIEFLQETHMGSRPFVKAMQKFDRGEAELQRERKAHEETKVKLANLYGEYDALESRILTACDEVEQINEELQSKKAELAALKKRLADAPEMHLGQGADNDVYLFTYEPDWDDEYKEFEDSFAVNPHIYVGAFKTGLQPGQSVPHQTRRPESAREGEQPMVVNTDEYLLRLKKKR